jgi:hypothetical protein
MTTNLEGGQIISPISRKIPSLEPQPPTIQPVLPDTTNVPKEVTHVNPIVPKPNIPKSNVNLTPTQPLNLQDYIAQAQRLGGQAFDARSQQVRQATKGFSDDLARSLYGQNVGVQSGIGRDITNRAIAEQGSRLEAIGKELSASQGLDAINKKFQLDNNLMQMGDQRMRQLYEDAKAGNFTAETANEILSAYIGLPVDVTTPEGKEQVLGFLNNKQLLDQQTAQDLGLQYDPMSGKYYAIDAKGSVRELTGAEVQEMANYGGYEGWRRATSKLATANEGVFQAIEKMPYGNREDILNILFSPNYTTPEARKRAVLEYINKVGTDYIQGLKTDTAGRDTPWKELASNLAFIGSKLVFDEYNVSGGGGLT